MLGHRDFVLGPGDAAKFDTHLPHWMGSTGDGPVELSLFGPQGGRVHLRALRALNGAVTGGAG